jgi:hypothetical protein
MSASAMIHPLLAEPYRGGAQNEKSGQGPLFPYRLIPKD